MITEVNDCETLIAFIGESTISIRWTLYPHEPAVVWLAPSAIRLSHDGVDISETAFWHRFKQLVSNSIGLFSHTPGATLEAKGLLRYENEILEGRIAMDVDYFETPDIPGTIDSGSLSSGVALYELRQFMEDADNDGDEPE
tara:strand:+ start:87 stop:509 length:423 start_codon:yes stop_codon:yes gene_type:complete